MFEHEFRSDAATWRVEEAIRDHLRRESGRALLRMSGSVEIEDVSAELRALDRRA